MPGPFRSRLVRLFEIFERALPTAAVALQVVDGLRCLFGTDAVEAAPAPTPAVPAVEPQPDPDDGWEIVHQSVYRDDSAWVESFMDQLGEGDRIIVMRREPPENP